MKMYKDKHEAYVEKTQVGLMAKSGWSLTLPKLKKLKEKDAPEVDEVDEVEEIDETEEVEDVVEVVGTEEVSETENHFPKKPTAKIIPKKKK